MCVSRADNAHVPLAGRFGFQREMNALKTLKTGEDSEDSTNVNALLHGTHEIELRLQQINRWFRLWKKDVRDGWVALGRFKVCSSLQDTLRAGVRSGIVSRGGINEQQNPRMMLRGMHENKLRSRLHRSQVLCAVRN